MIRSYSLKDYPLNHTQLEFGKLYETHRGSIISYNPGQKAQIIILSGFSPTIDTGYGHFFRLLPDSYFIEIRQGKVAV